MCHPNPVHWTNAHSLTGWLQKRLKQTVGLQKRLNKKLKLKVAIPEQLVVVVLSTAAVWAFSLDTTAGVATLGKVPDGLPLPKLPSMTRLPELLEGALVVAVVSIALCIATAKTFAAKNGYEIQPNQELLALGAALPLLPFALCSCCLRDGPALPLPCVSTVGARSGTTFALCSCCLRD